MEDLMIAATLRQSIITARMDSEKGKKRPISTGHKKQQLLSIKELIKSDAAVALLKNASIYFISSKLTSLLFVKESSILKTVLFMILISCNFQYVKWIYKESRMVNWDLERVELKRWYFWCLHDCPLTLKLLSTATKPNLECYLCCELIHEVERVNFPSCEHIYCRKCTRRYISTELEKEKIAICCPADCAGSQLSINNVEDLCWVEVTLFRQFNLVLLNLGLRSTPNLIQCPAPDCTNAEWAKAPIGDPSSYQKDFLSRICTLQLHSWAGRFKVDPVTGQDSRLFKCQYCAYSSCLLCRRLWTVGALSHAELTCEEYDEQAPKDAASLDKLSSDWISGSKAVRPCPNCKASIEKTEGCRHMTCRCSHEFCWRCAREWRVCRTDEAHCRDMRTADGVASPATGCAVQ